jgi:putative transposase
MNEQAIRKTFKYKLKPTPAQERELGRVLGLCCWLYNTALEQRIRAETPEYAAIHSPVLQDVLARPDKTYQAFFRRVKAGEKAGFPRY